MSDTGSTKFLIRVSLVASLGGLLFGYDTAVIAGAIGYLQQKFALSPLMVGWAASSAIWGCVIGAMVAGRTSDKFGRRRVLVVTGVLFTASAILSAIPETLELFMLARFIGGVGVGAASMLSPLYISELAPAKYRGTLVSLYQLAIVLGINLIYYVNFRIAGYGSESWNVEFGWRYMLGSECIPAVLFLVLLLFVPESPRWLVMNGMVSRAFTILSRINGKDRAKSVLSEIKEVAAEKRAFKELFKPGLRKAMIIGVVLALFSQITGINAIIYYAPEIFKSIGFKSESAFQQTVIIGTINTLFTFVALWLVDQAGRKKLLLCGVFGMIVCLAGTSACFQFELMDGPWLLIFILGFIASFASSLGPIPWVIMAEIFPTRSRGTAMSIATLTLWIGVLLVTQLTPVMLHELGGANTFVIFMINAFILLIFTWKVIPETKQKTLEQIEQSWGKLSN